MTLEEDIILDGVVPEPLNSRGYLGLTKKDLKKIESSMVVVYLPFLKKIISFSLYWGLKVFFLGGEGKVNRPQSFFRPENTNKY